MWRHQRLLQRPGPKRLLPGSRVSEGTLAFTLTAKFCDGLPFYRLEKILTRDNVKILRGLMCNWAIRVHKNLNSFYDLLKQKLLDCPVIGVDETRLRVLEVAGEKRNGLSYMWVFYGFGRDGPSAYEIFNKYSSFFSAKKGCAPEMILIF